MQFRWSMSRVTDFPTQFFCAAMANGGKLCCGVFRRGPPLAPGDAVVVQSVMTFDDVKTITLAWPGVELSTSYGTPALKVHGKLLTRLHEDGDSLVVKGVGQDERAVLCEAEPEVFHCTAHYRDWPIVLMRLSKARPESVSALLLRHWKEIAPKKLLKAFDAPQ